MASTKEVVYSLRDDKQELQKQIGCMNGIFQLFDRRYLLGHRRRHNQKRLPSSQSDNGDSKPSEQAKEKTSKVAMKEKQRVSIELPRSSFSSCSSSLDCSKRVQTEQSSSSQSVVSETSSSPFIPRKQPDFSVQSPDIRDVVRDSMTREPRVVSIRTEVGPAMKHIDSPRPIPHKKTLIYDGIGNDRNSVKETSRLSYDGRESRYSLKSNMKIKELPRLSLDSRQSCINNSTIIARRSLLGDMESAASPKNNKRPSSGVVARLMGLESITAAIDESASLKTGSLSQEAVSNSKSRKDEGLKRGVGQVITRIPLETAPWKQEGNYRGLQKPEKPAPASPSVYGAIEKRLMEHEFKSSGKDLRALKQILEAMQKTRRRLESENITIDDHKPVSPTIKGISPPRKHEFLKVDTKPGKRTPDLIPVGRQQLKDKNLTLRDKKSTSRPLSTSNFPDYISTSSRYSGPPGPRTQKSNKPLIHGPSSDLTRTRKQPGMQLGSRTRNLKSKSIDTLQEIKKSSQHSDTVSFQSESNSLASQNDSEGWIQEVNSPFQPKENHRVNIIERLTEDKPVADHYKHTMDQPSPVSVLDAFYTEDPPSPVKKKSSAFNDKENLHFEEEEDSEFNSTKLENIKTLVHQIELLNTKADDATVNYTPSEGETGDQGYVTEILLASGFLKDLVRSTTKLQLHPAGGLINPELFHVLEKTKGRTDLNHKSKSNHKMKRKLVFDTVNDVLGHKVAMLGPFGPKLRILNGEKLLKDVCSGIDSLQNNSEKGVYDEDDEVINIIHADVNKRSQDWEEYCYEVPGLVLDIERLIFKDLISEVVSSQVNSLQDWPVRHRRQLFPM